MMSNYINSLGLGGVWYRGEYEDLSSFLSNHVKPWWL